MGEYMERITDGGVFILDKMPATIDIPNSCIFKDTLISYFAEIENKTKSIQIQDVGCSCEIKFNWLGNDCIWPADICSE